MPKEMVRVFERDESNPNGKSKFNSAVKWPSMNSQELGRELERLQHQIWAKGTETIKVFDSQLVLHGETLSHAAKRIWKNATPNDFNADDRFEMLQALQSAIAGRHGQLITDRRVKFDAKASVPNWQLINLQTMKSNQYGTVLIWNQPKKATTTQETPPMSKTMYDSHTDGTGVCTPIFMLEDEHLERIIAGKAKQFANIRAKMSDAPKSTDPMIAAMGKSQKWSAEDLQTHTKSRLLEMHPYIAEALVRSKSSLVQASIDAMQLIANRQERVAPPAEVPLIELEEESF